MKTKTITYGFAAVVVYLAGDYLYCQVSNSIKEAYNSKLRHARNSGWSDGFDCGYEQGQIALIPYVDNEHYRHMYGRDLFDVIRNKD